MEIEIYHFANTPVVTVSSKNHFCSLQLVYESMYPLKLHVLPDFRTWPYLEMGSLQGQLGRLTLEKGGPLTQYASGVLIRRERLGDAHKVIAMCPKPKHAWGCRKSRQGQKGHFPSTSMEA